eukprot:6802936-Prymnesium_polylepis.1
MLPPFLIVSTVAWSAARGLQAPLTAARPARSVQMVFPSDMSPSAMRAAAQRKPPPPDDITDAMGQIAAEESALAPLETALLAACRPYFANGLRTPSQDACAAIEQRAVALERARGGARLRAQEASAIVQGDWKLVFTSSAATATGGITGYGAAPFCSTAAVLQRLSPSEATAGAAARGRVQCVE